MKCVVLFGAAIIAACGLTSYRVAAAAQALATDKAAIPGNSPPGAGATAPSPEPGDGTAGRSGQTSTASQTPAIAPTGTVVELEITQLVSSKTNNIGDKFTFRLSSPVMVGDRVVIPAGVPGVGEVIDAGHSGMGGHAGKLVLAGRYLDYQGKHIPIRALKLGGSGKNNANIATAVSALPYVGIVAPFIQGGSIDIPVGTVAYAKLGADVAATDDASQVPAAATLAPAVQTSRSPAAPPANQGLSK